VACCCSLNTQPTRQFIVVLHTLNERHDSGDEKITGVCLSTSFVAVGLGRRGGISPHTSSCARWTGYGWVDGEEGRNVLGEWWEESAGDRESKELNTGRGREGEGKDV